LRAAGTHEDDPAGVLGALNEAIYRQHPEQFCTAIYATIDPSTGALALALGGHPQPLVLRANGEVAAIGTPNLLLGPFEEWQGSPGRYILEPGETLFLYSDGVTEARSHAEFFGEERLIATIGSAFGLPVHAAVQLIESTVLAFAGKLSDDLAILAVQRAR